MAKISLICTDLDGTLYRSHFKAETVMAFRALLQSCSRRWRGRWAIVTGRPLRDMRPILMTLMSFGLMPDFVVLEDALIYRRTARGRLAPFWLWNLQVLRRRSMLFKHNTENIQNWRTEILEKFPGTVNRGQQMIDLWLEFVNDQVAAEAELMLGDRIADFTNFYVFRWGRELYLAPTAGTKGQAVRKLAKKLKISLADIYAVGDGPNDWTMLDGNAAQMTACVANALPEIQQTVARAGGRIAEQEVMAGVVETLDWYVKQAMLDD